MLFKNITTVDENFNIIENANILVENNIIKSINEEVPQDYNGEIYDGNDKLALPGFYNMHCHLPMNLLRGFGEGLPLDKWLTQKVFPFEDLLTDEDIYWGTLLGAAEIIASGGVSVTDMYMNMPAVAKAVNEIGLKANLSPGTVTPNDDVSFEDTKGYTGVDFLCGYSKENSNGKIKPELAIHAEYTNNAKVVKEAAKYAKKNGLTIHLHLSETQKEHEECKKRNGGLTPAQWFESLGVFENPAILAHCCYVDDNDIELLKRYDITVAHCPSSNLKLGSGVAPIKKLVNAGIRVTFGTDGAASNNNLNILEEIHLAALLHKGLNRDPLFLSVKEILKMATINGARAQRRDKSGLVKEGYSADIIVFDLKSIYNTPTHDLLANIIYSASVGDICLNMVAGKILYKNGSFLTVNIDNIKEKASAIARRVSAQLK